MAAEGFAPAPPRLHEDGIYLDLPMIDYVNDPAISGSGLKKLLISPADFKWELPAVRNPLYTPPESDARALGTLVHAGVLEGMEVFDARYFVAPELDDDDPRVIRTADHAKAWLKDHDVKCTGLKAELFERVKGHWDMLKVTESRGDDEGPIFLDEYIAQVGAGREQIKRKSYDYVAQVSRVVRAWPDAAELLRQGLAEVSIFWTENGVRYKARLDWLSVAAIIDVKKFGLMPMRGRSLQSQLQRDVVSYAYDIQAVHNSRATMQIPLLLAKGANVSASGEGARDRIAALETMAPAIARQAPDFVWMFLRTPGPPQGLLMTFPADSKRWAHCEWEIERAIENLQLYRKQCGDELAADQPWIEVGATTWDDDDMPEYTWEVAR